MATLPARQVPYFVPDIGDDEIQEVVDTLKSGWLTTGPKTKQFEQQFAEFIGVEHAVAVNSATSALQLALDAAGVREGDEVIVPTLTFASTAYVAVHLGARPVLVDCLDDTLNIDPELVARAVTPRTRAIVPVHYGGQPCEMDALSEIAARHKLRIVEDAAHALPARYRGGRIGTLSEMTCFSFYANKTITTGEGGMLATDDEQLAQRARIMSMHGISKDAWKRFSAAGSWYYEITAAGYKFNMTDINAALGLHQLRKCQRYWQRRAEIAGQYQTAFADVEELTLPHVLPHVENAWHLYVIRLALEKLTVDRAAFIEQLKQAQVGSSVHYMPLHLHPYYREQWGYRPESCPRATAIYDEIISLPIYPRMTDADVQYVIETVRRIVKDHRR